MDSGLSLPEVKHLVSLRLSSAGGVTQGLALEAINRTIRGVFNKLNEMSSAVLPEDKPTVFQKVMYDMAKADLSSRDEWGNTETMPTDDLLGKSAQTTITKMSHKQEVELRSRVVHICSKDRPSTQNGSNSNFMYAIEESLKSNTIISVQLLSFDAENANALILSSMGSDVYIRLGGFPTSYSMQSNMLNASHFVARAKYNRSLDRVEYALPVDKVVFDTPAIMPSQLTITLFDEFKRPLALRSDSIYISGVALDTTAGDEKIVFTTEPHNVMTGDIVFIKGLRVSTHPDLLSETKGYRASVIDSTHIALYEYIGGLTNDSFSLGAAYFNIPENGVKVSLRFTIN